MDHAGPDEAEIHILGALIIGNRTDRIVRVSPRWIIIIDVRVGNHGFINLVQINRKLSRIFRIGVRHQWRTLAGANIRDPLIRFGNQPLEHALLIVHALFDHDPDPALGYFEGLDQRLRLGNTDRGLGLHLCRPVGEGEGLVGQQRADMDFNDLALEDILTIKLIQHLGLRSMDNIAEIHVIMQSTLEGHFHRLRDRHGRLAGCQRQSHRSGISPESDAFRHPCV